jgi:hypothetical protein
VYSLFEELPNYEANVNLPFVIDQIKQSFEDKNNWKR